MVRFGISFGALLIAVYWQGSARAENLFGPESPFLDQPRLSADIVNPAPTVAAGDSAASTEPGGQGVNFASADPVLPPELLDYGTRPPDPSRAVAAWANWGNDVLPKTDWTIDYRFRGLCDSRTEYEFGTPTLPEDGYAPLSRLNFPISSCWHGLEIGVRRRTWELRCEWLTPQQNIEGQLSDYDWRYADQPFSDLGYAPERFIDGHMIDASGEFRLTEQFFGLPLELWPIGGFRWQRFNIMAYDLLQVRWKGEWLDPPYFVPGDIISLNQQYWIGYVGGQLRINLPSNVLPDGTLTLQGDWGHVEAYNVDHHLRREGDRYTMDRTHGNAVHVALIAEFPLHPRVSLGFQVDHTAIHTRGKHHLYNAPEHEDYTWSNGVKVNSDQTGVGAFVRVRL